MSQEPNPIWAAMKLPDASQLQAPLASKHQTSPALQGWRVTRINSFCSLARTTLKKKNLSCSLNYYLYESIYILPNLYALKIQRGSTLRVLAELFQVMGLGALQVFFFFFLAAYLSSNFSPISTCYFGKMRKRKRREKQLCVRLK